MLIHNGILSPEAFPVERVRKTLRAAVASAGAFVRSGDVLAGAIQTGDPAVAAVLTQALHPQSKLADVVAVLQAGRAPLAEVDTQLDRPVACTPALLVTLVTFETTWRPLAQAVGDAALEMLLHILLLNLEPDDLARLSMLHVPQAVTLFRERVTMALQQHDLGARRTGAGRTQTETTDPAPNEFLLPPELAPSVDLTERARTAVPAVGGLDSFPFDQEPLYEGLFEAIARVLHRRQANHVLLTGERGVGKSTVVAELARRAATGQIPFLARRRFLSVDCRYVPPDESRARLAGILAEVTARPELIVCLDGLPALLRSERMGNNRAVLLAGLAHARCQLIGLLTPREYEECISDEPSLAELFTRLEVEEPDQGVALKLLRHFARGLEERFQVAIDDEAVNQAVVLSANYILNDQLPAKALKILHRVCEDLDYERSQQGAVRARVTDEDVLRQVAQQSGVPEETLRGIAERSDYEQSLKEVIFGQDHVVREVATELGLIKAGMTDPNKPASVMLFLGQTGTGKTEMAKALARFYSTSKRLKTYTLGNCVEPHSVATIIGVPPGYVGNDQGGRLINELNADPYCVFLLDEADKAHPDVLQPFLNLFDEGWVSDQRGAKAYANKSIFILTTNVGQRMIAEMAKEGKSREEIAARMKEALSQIRHTKSERPVFTPEFLSRIKRVIVFNPLDRVAMHGIAGKLTADLRESWTVKRGKQLRLPEELIQYLGDQAYEQNEKVGGKEGGRLVRKLLAEWVEAALQRAISERPGEYKGCTEVVMELAEALPTGKDGETSIPKVVVRLEPEGRS